MCTIFLLKEVFLVCPEELIRSFLSSGESNVKIGTLKEINVDTHIAQGDGGREARDLFK